MQVKYLFIGVSRTQLSMYVQFVVIGLVFFSAITWTVMIGSDLVSSAIGTVLIGLMVVPIWTTAIMKMTEFERRSWRASLDPKVHSWAYLFGDPLLVLALGVSAYTWHDHPSRIPQLFHHCWWTLLCAVLGIAGGFGFRFKENPRYPLQSLRGPFKVFHDWIVVPLLIGALLACTFPLLFCWGWTTVVALGLVTGWGILAVIDDHRGALNPQHRFYLNPELQHIRWDAVKFQPVIYASDR